MIKIATYSNGLMAQQLECSSGSHGALGTWVQSWHVPFILHVKTMGTARNPERILQESSLYSSHSSLLGQEYLDSKDSTWNPGGIVPEEHKDSWQK